jgi:hypothetical protein
VVVLCVATIVFSGLGLRQAWTDGPTYDEATELTAALTALTRHDLRATPQHPPLFRELAAAPLLLWHPYVPGGAAWERGSGHDLAAQLMHHEAMDGHLRRDLFVVRVLPVVETVAVAWLLALLAGGLFGSAAGLFAAALWLADPFVIGLGHLDGIDIPATLTTVLVALAVLAARRNPTRRAVMAVGLCGGLAVLARLSGVLIVLAAAVAVAAAADPGGGDERRGNRRAAAVRGATVVAVAWATVMFAYIVLSPVDVAPGRPGALGLLAVVGHVVLPPEWWRGTRHLLRVGSEPGPAFVLGRAHTGRWLLFWPASLAVKLPPTTLAVLATIPLTWARVDRAVRREAAWVVGLPAVAHILFTVQQQRPRPDAQRGEPERERQEARQIANECHDEGAPAASLTSADGSNGSRPFRVGSGLPRTGETPKAADRIEREPECHAGRRHSERAERRHPAQPGRAGWGVG